MNMFKDSGHETPASYIAALEEPQKTEMKRLDALIKKTVPKLKPYMQSGMVGYGKFHHVYESGREGDWPLIALASRKQYISLYVCAADGKKYLTENYKNKLPKADIGKSCIRFKHVADIDLDVIADLLKEAEQWLKNYEKR